MATSGNEILAIIEGWPYLRGFNISNIYLNGCNWDQAKERVATHQGWPLRGCWFFFFLKINFSEFAEVYLNNNDRQGYYKKI